MLFLIFACFFGALQGGELELFCDYLCEAKGQELFPLVEGKDIPLMSLLRQRLIERGDDIRSWELDVYRPHLLTWGAVKGFQDFKFWLGSYFNKKEIISPNTKYWVFWNLGPKLRDFNFSKIPKEKMVLVMWEPPAVQEELYDPRVQAFFGKIFTWDDDLVDNQKFYKFHYPVLSQRIQNIPSFEEKKFCVMINQRLTSKHPKELYSERKRAIEFFEEKPGGEFDLYVFNWKKKKYKNYQGTLANKLEALKNYKYSICYENTRDVKGYISEKIFDCFAAGVVPIYWGASNVTDYIPEGCFIDRRKFADHEELYKFLKAITKEEYEAYQDSAQEFLNSDQAKVFSKEHFVDNFLLKTCSN